jgi:ATP-dependent Clp protease ATP-binding subunit ClpA
VKSNPFAVLLFDEIEKAHPSIMDKFLQILEDGRMTDGQGNTVYFSETLIFFTSNAGISEEVRDMHGRVIERKIIVQPGSSYEEIQQKVEAAIKTNFKPEVVNRIGKNIIVFNYITEEATSEILQKQLGNITQGIAKKSKIEIELTTSAAEHLLKRCLDKEARENGGRGIGNVVESEFLNPLAEFIFDNDCRENDKVTISTEGGKLGFARNSND